MEDNRTDILGRSVKIISRLQVLSAFFGDETVYHIFIRTQVIHKLFDTQPELDINKLELFHLQYTEAVIELLRNVKKSNENDVLLAQNEVAYNEELITKLKHTLHTTGNFSNEAAAHTVAVNNSLHKLYDNLSGYSAEPPFPKNIIDFGQKNAGLFYPEISSVLMDEMLLYDPVEVYKNGYGTIEKKLLGWQCKYGFDNTFIGGVKADDRLLEVYKLNNKDIYFIFYPARFLMLDLDYEKISSVNFSLHLSKEEKLIKELSQKNTDYQNRFDEMKTAVPESVKGLLQEYEVKTASLDFTNDEFDIQANILKTMLNTNGI